MCNVLYNEDMFVCLRFVWGFTAQSVLLRSCWASQLIYSHCSWAVLGLLSGEPVLSAHTFASNWQLPFLNQRKGGNGCSNYLSRLMTKWLYTQQRLRSTWASTQSDQSSMSAWRKLGSLPTHWAHSEDSDQTGRTVILLVLSWGGSISRSISKICGLGLKLATPGTAVRHAANCTMESAHNEDLYLSIRVKLLSKRFLPRPSKPKAPFISAEVQCGLLGRPANATQPLVCHCGLVVKATWRKNETN